MTSERAKPSKKSGSVGRSTESFSPRKGRHSASAYPSVALIGCGNWGTALARALGEARIPLKEIVIRRAHAASQGSQARARNLAAAVGARLTTLDAAALDAEVLWICTPDSAIAGVAQQTAHALEKIARPTPPVVFHSSGALASEELAVLRAAGASLASVHPLMTFPKVSAARPGPPQHLLAGVPFAIEGDPRACRTARRLVRGLGGEAFTLPAKSKPLYHAYGAFVSPLLVALLTAAMETGVAAGSAPRQTKRRMRPIVERTVRNFFVNGPEKSFSGPMARGDTGTIARHLAALRPYPELHAVYRQLARFAAATLPAKNRHPIEKLLQRPF